MARLSSTQTRSTASSTKRRYEDEDVLCDCEEPTVVYTSTTPKNPGRLFRVCRNRNKEYGKTCKLWRWVDEENEIPMALVDESATVKVELLALMKEVTGLKDVVLSIRVILLALAILCLLQIMS